MNNCPFCLLVFIFFLLIWLCINNEKISSSFFCWNYSFCDTRIKNNEFHLCSMLKITLLLGYLAQFHRQGHNQQLFILVLFCINASTACFQVVEDYERKNYQFFSFRNTETRKAPTSVDTNNELRHSNSYLFISTTSSSLLLKTSDSSIFHLSRTFKWENQFFSSHANSDRLKIQKCRKKSKGLGFQGHNYPIIPATPFESWVQSGALHLTTTIQREIGRFVPSVVILMKKV